MADDDRDINEGRAPDIWVRNKIIDEEILAMKMRIRRLEELLEVPWPRVSVLPDGR